MRSHQTNSAGSSFAIIPLLLLLVAGIVAMWMSLRVSSDPRRQPQGYIMDRVISGEKSNPIFESSPSSSLKEKSKDPISFLPLSNIWKDEEAHDIKNFGLPTAIVWACQHNIKMNNCSSFETDFHYPTIRPEPHSLTMADRISTIGWKYIPEVTYFGPFEQWERFNFHHPLECYLSCLQPYTVVWVDSNVFLKFWNEILPLIRVPIVLFSADGDTTQPIFDLTVMTSVQIAEIKKKIPQWYIHNCDRDVLAYLDWITCVPVGLSQMENNLHRNRIHAALSLRWGHYGKLLTSNDVDNNHISDQVETTKHTKNNVLVTFSVQSNVAARQPVRDWFCDVMSNSSGQKIKDSPFHSIGGGTATCELSLDTHPFNAGKIATETLSRTGDYNHLSVSSNYHHLFHAFISEHRFVASPMGAGFDCYRTYEILMMGSYPIVKTSQLDMLYKVISPFSTYFNINFLCLTEFFHISLGLAGFDCQELVRCYSTVTQHNVP